MKQDAALHRMLGANDCIAVGNNISSFDVELFICSGKCSKLSQILTKFLWQLIKFLKFGSDFGSHKFFGRFTAATRYLAHPDIGGG